MEQRKILIEKLSEDLKGIYLDLHSIANEINNISSSYLDQFFLSNKDNLEKEVEKLKANIIKIKEYNLEVTKLINNWYDFTNNTSEIKKIIFPLKFYFKKLGLQKKISRINERIYKISVENRLIREKLKNIEKDLEYKAIQEIKQSGMYKKYEDLLKDKSRLIGDLNYLLPTTTLQKKEINLGEYLALD